MKVLSFLGAIGFGIFSAAWIVGLRRRSSPLRGKLININQASQEEIMRSLGLDAETAERIVEQRPYPSKIDLLGRMVVPGAVYNAIKNRISYQAS